MASKDLTPSASKSSPAHDTDTPIPPTAKTDVCPGGLCVPPPTVSCVPPLLWHTDRCECPDGSLPTYSGTTPMCIVPPPPPPPAILCQVTISYPQTVPAAPQVSTVTPGCDAAGLELAIVIILGRMLGAPP